MTKTPSRNTKISLIALGTLGIFAFLAMAYNIDKLYAGGLAVREVVQTCDIVGSGCSSAVSSIFQIMGSPRELLLSFALATLVLALLKASVTIISARRAVARFKYSGVTSSRVNRILNELGFGDVRIKVAKDSDILAFTYGMVKPKICLSTGLIERLDDEELSALIAHEVAHIKHRDNLAIFLALFIRDFLWPLPVSHHLFSILVHEKEFAADDFAVKATGRPVDLASAIVSVAKSSRGRRMLSPAYTTFFSTKATAKDRVERLLESGDRLKPSIYKLVVSIVLSAVIVLSVVGVAYAQPYAKAGVNGQCEMDRACVQVNYSCCNSK